MKEGFYSISFTGLTGDSGFGIIVLDTDVVVGVDIGGVQYDGTYNYNPKTELIDVDVTLTVPAGMPLVGAPARADEWRLDFKASFPRETTETPVLVNTPFGPVNAIIRYLRGFPD